MEKFSFDVVSQTLTMTAKFAKMMNDTQSDEYKLVAKFRNDFPNLTITKKTHKSATHYTTKSGEKFNCNQFKNLTYKNMEQFMSALPENEGYFGEYKFLRDNATRIQHNGYALVRRWFVAQFPHFRKNPLFYVYNTPTLVPASQVIAEVEAEAETQEHKKAA